VNRAFWVTDSDAARLPFVVIGRRILQ